MTHSRKEELIKEDARMAYMTRQRHKLEAHWGDESKASESTAELHAGGEVLRAGSTHWELFVSLFHPLWDYQGFALLVCVCCCVGRFLLVFVGWLVFPFFAFDAQGRHSFQDCHHRHDERSTGAKKSDPGCAKRKNIVLLTSMRS